MAECALRLDQLIEIKIIPFQYCMPQKKGEKVLLQIFWVRQKLFEWIQNINKIKNHMMILSFEARTINDVVFHLDQLGQKLD